MNKRALLTTLVVIPVIALVAAMASPIRARGDASPWAYGFKVNLVGGGFDIRSGPYPMANADITKGSGVSFTHPWLGAIGGLYSEVSDDPVKGQFAKASTARVTIKPFGIDVGVLSAKCKSAPGGKPVAESNFVDIKVFGVPIKLDPGPNYAVVLDNPFVRLIVNHQTWDKRGRLTVTALHLEILPTAPPGFPKGDLAIAQATCGPMKPKRPCPTITVTAPANPSPYGKAREPGRCPYQA